jgi:hypothetical protein
VQCLTVSVSYTRSYASPGNLNPTCQPVHIAKLAKAETAMKSTIVNFSRARELGAKTSQDSHPESPNTGVTRRNFLAATAATTISAPAIVRVSSLMPIRALPDVSQALTSQEPIYLGFTGALRLFWMEKALKRGWSHALDSRTFGGISEANARAYVISIRERSMTYRVS